MTKAERPACLLPNDDNGLSFRIKNKRHETRVQQKLFKALLNPQLQNNKNPKEQCTMYPEKSQKAKTSIKLRV